MLSISAQTSPSPTADIGDLEIGASAQVGMVSKYLWRGQRLTNDWSLQPSGTISVGNFSANVWGTLDLVAVNEGDALLIKENPASEPGNDNGLRGKFSEVDYTFSYSLLTRNISFDFGSIVYTFPERSASLPSTVEVYGSVEFESLPLSPASTLYIDVDETREAGDAGLYLQVSGGRAFTIGHARFPAIDLSGWIGFANKGFGAYYYGVDESGIHDLNLTVSLPVNLSERAGTSLFLAYSGLLGDFRDHQYRDARDIYRGTAGSSPTYADAVWGGVNLSFDF